MSHRLSRSGVGWASQVPGASFPACHGLMTPAALRNLTFAQCSEQALQGVRDSFVLATCRLKHSPTASAFSRLYQLFRMCGHPYGLHRISVYASPVLFAVYAASCYVTGATLDTGGWLALTRRGLAPCKMHQASLGALTPSCGAAWSSPSHTSDMLGTALPFICNISIKSLLK